MLRAALCVICFIGGFWCIFSGTASYTLNEPAINFFLLILAGLALLGLCTTLAVSLQSKPSRWNFLSAPEDS